MGSSYADWTSMGEFKVPKKVVATRAADRNEFLGNKAQSCSGCCLHTTNSYDYFHIGDKPNMFLRMGPISNLISQLEMKN